MLLVFNDKLEEISLEEGELAAGVEIEERIIARLVQIFEHI